MKRSNPTLFLDKEIALGNLKSMLQKTKDNNVRFRPHFKTHQSADIGKWFLNNGVDTITVSSVRMANYFADNGFKDILIAVPMNPANAPTLNKLAKECKLSIISDNLFAIKELDKRLEKDVELFLKIDTGYGRAGIKWNDAEGFLSFAEAANKMLHLKFKGILAHYGHTYSAKNPEQVREIFNKSTGRISEVRNQIENSLGRMIEVSIGDTPSSSLMTDFKGIDELRPGNFIFYDLMQSQIKSCEEKNIAVHMDCPVLSVYQDRNEILIHGGGVHFSKESILDSEGDSIFGKVFALNGKRDIDPEAFKFIKLSQEHGIIKSEERAFKCIVPGDVLSIYPIHSCLTANLMQEYHTFDGETITMMPANYPLK